MSEPPAYDGEVSVGNADRYSHLYATRKAFLRYPAEWVIRFHALHLRHRPPGRILDFGFGSGNNLRLFADNGWRLSGVEVTPEALALATLNNPGVDLSDLRILPADESWRLPWGDNTFDVVLANQVLYYLPRDARRAVREFWRVLAPGGWVAVSMIGRQNDYARGLTGLVEVEPPARLGGPKERVWVVEESDLGALLSDFEDVQTGYYDSRVPGKERNFHWIALARKP